MSLNDQVAFITGGAVGLGKCIAGRLAEDGARLVLFAPEEDQLQQTSDELRAAGADVLPIVGDVTSEQSIQDAVARTQDSWGPVDILVNNSGIAGPTAMVSDVALADWDDCLAINLTGAFLCCKAVAPEMIRRRSGKIINISSIAGRIGYALRSPYAVSKWGMVGLTKSLANELGPYEIQVNVILPGPVQGERMNNVIAARAKETGQTIEEATAGYTDKAALRRMVKPEDISSMVAFLASPAGNNITGESLDVSAGYGW